MSDEPSERPTNAIREDWRLVVAVVVFFGYVVVGMSWAESTPEVIAIEIIGVLYWVGVVAYLFRISGKSSVPTLQDALTEVGPTMPQDDVTLQDDFSPQDDIAGAEANE